MVTLLMYNVTNNVSDTLAVFDYGLLQQSSLLYLKCVVPVTFFLVAMDFLTLCRLADFPSHSL